MKHGIINVLGMELEQWQHESCTAEFGVSDGYASLYSIKSKQEGKGHATFLLKEAKSYYEAKGLKVIGTIALNERMRRLYQYVGIPEVTE